MVPIHEINPQTDVDIEDSCNCWSNCCPQQKDKEKILDEKIRRVVMDELTKQGETHEKPIRSITDPNISK